METVSPINIEKLSKQNKRLFEWLSKGNTIHIFHEAKNRLGIGYLNSRISDLTNVHHVKIYKRNIKINDVTVKEYSIFPFESHERQEKIIETITDNFQNIFKNIKNIAK